MSKKECECPKEFEDKQITKVVKDSEKISHIEFVDKKKKKKGCIFYDCTVAGITPVSTGTAGFYKVKNAAFVDDDTRHENMEYPRPIDMTKDLFPCSKKENACVIKFIKSNLYKNKDIMTEEVFDVCSHLVDNYNFEKILNDDVQEEDFE